FSLAAVQNSRINFCFRHIPVIEPVKESAGCRHAWRLKIGRIDRWKGAILGVAAGISQISNARGSDDAASPFLYLVE
ncbi:MAG: hypothetical protein O6932_02740, partial [Gammaproteobacteria bacterium]|nr:hypothetical protein [Gammaproteobacteria bacterium]